jgi:hypothetical protein
MNILGIIASSKFGDAGDFESIATVTVGSGGVSEIDFTSISSTYTHLQLRGLSRTTRLNSGDGDGIQIQFNTDTGNNYAWHYLSGNGSAASASATTSTNRIALFQGADDAGGSNEFGAFVIDLLDYKNTNKYKTVRSLGGYDSNGTGQLTLGSGLWQNTNAITAIKIKAVSASNLMQYTTFALYGIRSA